MRLIKDALNRHRNVAVSWSGGRCSTAVLHMVRKIEPDILVYHCDHGVHFPETVKYVKEMADEWDLNLYIERPYEDGPTFWDIVEEKGFPRTRKAGVGQEATPCCYHLKDKPQVDFRKEHNVQAFIDGMRVAEARVRMFSTSDWGQYRHVTKSGLDAWKYSPIAFWTTERLQEYIEENDISINPLYYEGKDRVGCWPCSAYVKWKEQLAKVDPNKLKFLLDKMGSEQKLLEHFEKTEVEPCKGRG